SAAPATPGPAPGAARFQRAAPASFRGRSPGPQPLDPQDEPHEDDEDEPHDEDDEPQDDEEPHEDDEPQDEPGPVSAPGSEPQPSPPPDAPPPHHSIRAAAVLVSDDEVRYDPDPAVRGPWARAASRRCS